MRRLLPIFLVSILCLLTVGCKKDKEEAEAEVSKTIKIYGTITAFGEPVPDCSVTAKQPYGTTYANTITGMDGAYEVSFVPTDTGVETFGADVNLTVSLYGSELETKYLKHIILGSTLHYDFDITGFFDYK